MEWRSGIANREEYLKGRNDYRRLCKTKKEEWNKELMKEARKAKTQEGDK